MGSSSRTAAARTCSCTRPRSSAPACAASWRAKRCPSTPRKTAAPARPRWPISRPRDRENLIGLPTESRPLQGGFSAYWSAREYLDRDWKMAAFKGDDFNEKLSAAANAKKALLDKFRARPGPDDPAVREREEARRSVVAAREERAAERERAREAEAARLAAEQVAREAEAARVAAEQAARVAAEKAEREEREKAL